MDVRNLLVAVALVAGVSGCASAEGAGDGQAPAARGAPPVERLLVGARIDEAPVDPAVVADVSSAVLELGLPDAIARGSRFFHLRADPSEPPALHVELRYDGVPDPLHVRLWLPGPDREASLTTFRLGASEGIVEPHSPALEAALRKLAAPERTSSARGPG